MNWWGRGQRARRGAGPGVVGATASFRYAHPSCAVAWRGTPVVKVTFLSVANKSKENLSLDSTTKHMNIVSLLRNKCPCDN
jgi:hypothetical protein